MQTQNKQFTDRRTTLPAKQPITQRWSFFFSFTDVTLTVSGQWPKVTPNSYVHYIWKLIQSLSDDVFSQSRVAEAHTATLSGLHLFSLQILVLAQFPTVFFRLASPSLSPFSKTPFKKPAMLHFHVALTSQLELHTGYSLTTLHNKISTFWKQAQLLILHNHRLSLLQSLKCTKAPDVI